MRPAPFNIAVHVLGSAVADAGKVALAVLGPARASRMTAGGYRVSPNKVETALATHPGIEEAVPVDLRVKADTSVIAAFYTGPAPLPEAELAAFASRRLARYKCPRPFIHRAALPRGANNKLLRRALRQEWETDHGQA